MEYSVCITETLQRFIEVEADSRDEAEEIAEREWKEGIHILDADNFAGVSFSAIEKTLDAPEPPKNRARDGYGR